MIVIVWSLLYLMKLQIHNNQEEEFDTDYLVVFENQKLWLSVHFKDRTPLSLTLLEIVLSKFSERWK